VEDQNDFPSCRPFDFHKTINQGEEIQEEDSPEDSLEEEDSPEEEDSQEAEDTQEEEEYHLEGHQGAVGDHHRYPYRKPIKENW